MGYNIERHEITVQGRPKADPLREKQYIDFVREEDGIRISRYNSDWFLSDKGDMYTIDDYAITSDRLAEDDWILHLMEKGWFDANTFLPAYFEACSRANIKKVTILTEY